MPDLITLSNGVRLYVDPMPGLESAAVGIWARAGTVDEAADEGGVAHLLEHMAFKGTRKRSARAIAEEIEAVGGHLNAGTSYQRTGYYARVLKPDMGVALDILADILVDPLFDAEELAKEREVVVQEIGEASDTPDDAVAELLQAEAFKGAALGKPILGTVESVRGHDAARLRGFMRRLYGPQNLLVVAAGAVDPDMIARFIEDSTPKGAGAAAPSRAAQGYEGGAAHDPRDIEQTHIAVAFPAVGARHADFYATRVFAEALGGGMASRLFQTIREERGLAYSVYAYADCYDDVGVVGAYAGTDADKAAEATALIRAGIEASARDLSQAELDRARAMLKSTLLMGLESPMGRIETAAAQAFTFGAPLSPAAMRAQLDAVTLDDVKRCARRALDGAPSLAIVGPCAFDTARRTIGAAA